MPPRISNIPALLAFDFACEVVLTEENRLCIGVQLCPAVWDCLGVWCLFHVLLQHAVRDFTTCLRHYKCIFKKNNIFIFYKKHYNCE